MEILEWLASQQNYFLGVVTTLLGFMVKFYLDQVRDERKNKPVFLLEDKGLDSDMKGRLDLLNIGTVDALNVQMRRLAVFSRSTGRGVFKVTSKPIPFLGVGNQESFILEWVADSQQEQLPELIRTGLFSRYAKRNYKIEIDCKTASNHRYRTRLRVGKEGVRHLVSYKIRIRNRIKDIIWDCVTFGWYGTWFYILKFRNYIKGPQEEEGF